MIKRYLLSAILLFACDPAYTLPPAPKVGCGVTYAILGSAAVTFSGGQLSIKGDGQAASTSLVRTTAGTGRLVWNGLHWVHIGGG